MTHICTKSFVGSAGASPQHWGSLQRSPGLIAVFRWPLLKEKIKVKGRERCGRRGDGRERKGREGRAEERAGRVEKGGPP